MKQTLEIKKEDAMLYVQSLPSESIDLVLTDPPYAISRETNFQSGDEKGTDVDRFRVSYDFGEWDVVDDIFETQDVDTGHPIWYAVVNVEHLDHTLEIQVSKLLGVVG